ncbi:hypothetical protein TNCV_1966061 [Trichonephila clavipes]|nr:hypothetical protein TNCV_1966061 [Trichonephila clavipes]
MQKTEFQMLNDDEIMTSVQEESNPVDDETDEEEDNNESSKGPSNADAFSNQSPCGEKMKVYNNVHVIIFNIRIVSGFICCMDLIRLSERCPVPIDSDKRRSTV